MIDVRSLALFRIALGMVCLFDLRRRWPSIELFYSNEGIYSNHFALFQQTSKKFSLLLAFSSPAEVKAFFICTAVVAALFCMGYRVRTVTPILLLLMTSIINRNPLTIYGGDSVIIATLVLAVFLPTAQVLSLDSLLVRSEKAKVTLNYRAPAVFFAYVQLAVIYIFAGLQKSGSTWMDGEAFYLALFQGRIVTETGVLLRELMPFSLLKLCTYAALSMEVLGGFLVLSPWRTSRCRGAAFIILGILQFLIWLCFDIGMFQYVMLGFSLILIPGEWWGRWYGSEPLKSPRLESFSIDDLRVPIRIFGALLVCAAAMDLLLGNKLTNQYVNFARPHVFLVFPDYFSHRQSWGMFSPEAPRSESLLYFEGVSTDGQAVDIFSGRVSAFAEAELFNQRWTSHKDYLMRLSIPAYSYLKIEVERWLRERRAGLDKDTFSKVRTVNVWKITRESPNFSVYPRMPQQPSRELLWSIAW